MAAGTLSGTRVIVAGAGLAGLSAARDLEAAGAAVTLVEARERVGGRVHTLRDGFAAGRHAEAGADLIEGEQTHVLDLAAALKLEPVRILRDGWGYYGPDATGRRRVQTGPGTFEETPRRLKPEIDDYCLAGKRWDSAVAAGLARQSVADWLARIRADRPYRSGLRGLRGFFLADPEDLSLIALVDQFATGESPGEGRMFRINGGNDALATAAARALRGRQLLGTVVRRVQQTDRRVVVTIEQPSRREIRADYLVVALPASTLGDVEFDPPLPERQRRAIGTLRYGPATRILLQFARAFWRKPLAPRAYGSDLPTGAVWE